MSTYLIRPAGAGDVDAMLALRREAEAWLAKAGRVQWTPDYREYADDALRRSVAAGIAWVVEDQGAVVATVSLSTEADLDFWTADDLPRSALYLQRLIVARSHAARELGDAIQNWACEQAEAAGRRWVRLDCRRDNWELHAYYVARGWQPVRIQEPRRRTESGALFQRPAGLILPAASVVAERLPERVY